MIVSALLLRDGCPLSAADIRHILIMLDRS